MWQPFEADALVDIHGSDDDGGGDDVCRVYHDVRPDDDHQSDDDDLDADDDDHVADNHHDVADNHDYVADDHHVDADHDHDVDSDHHLGHDDEQFVNDVDEFQFNDDDQYPGDRGQLCRGYAVTEHELHDRADAGPVLIRRKLFDRCRPALLLVEFR